MRISVDGKYNSKLKLLSRFNIATNFCSDKTKTLIINSQDGLDGGIQSNTDFHYSELQLELIEDELIICSTIIDSNNYSILTTQKLITNENGIKNTGNLIGATLKPYGNFKDLNLKPCAFGLLQLENGTELKYLIETGKASMIMIHGLRTLIKTQQMTDKNVENATRI